MLLLNIRGNILFLQAKLFFILLFMWDVNSDTWELLYDLDFVVYGRMNNRSKGLQLIVEIRGWVLVF